jgi:hypothetical protein
MILLSSYQKLSVWYNIIDWVAAHMASMLVLTNSFVIEPTFKRRPSSTPQNQASQTKATQHNDRSLPEARDMTIHHPQQ